MIDRSALRRELLRDEGLRLKPYRDSVGKLTIGVGRNLDDVGISRDEALVLLDHDIDKAFALVEAEPWWASVAVEDVRARVMLNMIFNLGPSGLARFVRLLKAVETRRWQEAAAEMRASLWARQTGARAERLARMMETGEA